MPREARRRSRVTGGRTLSRPWLGAGIVAVALWGAGSGCGPRAPSEAGRPAADGGVRLDAPPDRAPAAPDAGFAAAPNPFPEFPRDAGPGRFPAVATDCHLDRAGKSVRWPKRDRAVEAMFYSRPHVKNDDDETRCVFFIALSEINTRAFGKIVTLSDRTNGICLESPVRDRSYVLGAGTPDACGSVTYHGEVATPRFSKDTDPLYGDQWALGRLTFEDHRARVSTCPPAAAPMILHEDVTVSGKALVARTRYSSSTTLPRPVARAAPAACIFFDKPGQSERRQPRPCEVGTYLQEDDTGTKIVELRDWVDGSCSKARPTARGSRVYWLGIGEVDSCGSIRYGPGRTEWGEVTGWNNGSEVHGSSNLYWNGEFDMIDNRFRRLSASCPAARSRVELFEGFYRADLRPPAPPYVLKRRFYAPRAGE